ncbi:hypothetical protein K438DRAFT_1997413 [Mycena galopus ATCC 62051]|nr:hypothetical protein K438DRAFT_1997413 [Mycena galopus ATCC 62051]
MSASSQLAFTLDAILCGIALQQGWNYTYWWPSDKLTTKLTVLSAMGFQLMEVVFFFLSLTTKISNVGKEQWVWLDSAAMPYPKLPPQLQLICIYLLVALIQIYFTMALRHLLGLGLSRPFANWWLAFATFIAFTLALVQLGAGMTQVIISFWVHSLTSTRAIKVATALQTVASSICDVVTITVFCLVLRASGVGPTTDVSQHMFKTLKASALVRGSLTALTSILTMVLYVSFPGSYWFMVALAPCSKLHLLSLLTKHRATSLPAISTGAGPKAARALATHGFGRTLVKVVETFRGSDLHLQLDRWRNTLRHELRENSAGLLTKRYPKLADDISDAFPSLPILRLYLDPLTSRSPRFMGPQPDVVVSVLTNTQHDVSYNPKLKLFTSSSTKATLQKATKLTKYNASFIDSGALDIYRVRLSTSYFVALAGLDAIVAEEKIKLVSIPRVILSSAMRESSSVSTDIWTLGSDEEDFAANKSANDASDCCKEDSNAGHGGQRDEDNVIELTDDDEKDFTDVHAKLAAQGIIDLTGELD